LHRLNDLVHRSFQPLASSLPPGKIEPIYLRRTKVAAARVQVQPVLCTHLSLTLVQEEQGFMGNKKRLSKSVIA
jgi:hypothetical protein